MSPGPADYHVSVDLETDKMRSSTKHSERLKSACSIKNLKMKEKELLGKFYLKKQWRENKSEEAQGDFTTFETYESKGDFR